MTRMNKTLTGRTHKAVVWSQPRVCECGKVQHDGREKFFITLNFEAGKPREMFLHMDEDGSTLDGMANCVGILISLLLKHGVPLKEIAERLAWQRFDPQGRTENKDADLRVCTSVVDYAVRWALLESNTQASVSSIGNKTTDTEAVRAVPSAGTARKAMRAVSSGAEARPANLEESETATASDPLAGERQLRAEPLFCISRFRSALVRHGVISSAAIADPEGYDGGLLLAATREAYKDVMESARLDRPAASAGTVGIVVCGPPTPDTKRLDFLLQFFRVDDTGDEGVCPGMLVDTDAVSDAFDCGPLVGEVVTLMGGWQNPDMRRAIDKAIAFHSANAEGDGSGASPDTVRRDVRPGGAS